MVEQKKSLLCIKEYGKIELKLKEQLAKRQMTRGELARAINARFEVVNKWYSGQVERLDTDILARMCFVLQCEVQDLIKYKR